MQRGGVAVEYALVTLLVTTPLLMLMGQVAAGIATRAAYSRVFLTMAL